MDKNIYRLVTNEMPDLVLIAVEEYPMNKRNALLKLKSYADKNGYSIMQDETDTDADCILQILELRTNGKPFS
jgi:hypothetical protein